MKVNFCSNTANLYTNAAASNNRNKSELKTENVPNGKTSYMLPDSVSFGSVPSFKGLGGSGGLSGLFHDVVGVWPSEIAGISKRAVDMEKLSQREKGYISRDIKSAQIMLDDFENDRKDADMYVEKIYSVYDEAQNDASYAKAQAKEVLELFQNGGIKNGKKVADVKSDSMIEYAPDGKTVIRKSHFYDKDNLSSITVNHPETGSCDEIDFFYKSNKPLNCKLGCIKEYGNKYTAERTLEFFPDGTIQFFKKQVFRNSGTENFAYGMEYSRESDTYSYIKNSKTSVTTGTNIERKFDFKKVSSNGSKKFIPKEYSKNVGTFCLDCDNSERQILYDDNGRIYAYGTDVKLMWDKTYKNAYKMLIFEPFYNKQGRNHNVKVLEYHIDRGYYVDGSQKKDRSSSLLKFGDNGEAKMYMESYRKESNVASACDVLYIKDNMLHTHYRVMEDDGSGKVKYKCKLDFSGPKLKYSEDIVKEDGKETNQQRAYKTSSGWKNA